MPRLNNLLLALVFFFPLTLSAQQYPFVYYTPKDGLVSTRARNMFQDSKGRLFITTFGGLSIYDGARFTNYTINNGLSDNIINDVVEMGEDSVWIIPNTNKINCLVHGRMKNFIPADGFSPVINKLIKHSDGLYYALTDEGLYRFENKRFTAVPLKNQNGKAINRNFNRGIEVNNKLFIVTDPAVAMYPSPSYLIVYDLLTGRSCISSKPPEIFDIIESPQKEILIATSAGLKTINRGALENNQIILSNASFPYGNLNDKVASTLYFDKEENLWLTTYEGIFVADKFGKAKIYTVENGLPVNPHYSVYQDREGIMWFLNDQTGLSKLSDRHIEFYKQIKSGFFTTDLFTDANTDSVWFADGVQKKLLLQYPGGSKEFTIPNASPWFYRFIPGQKTNFLTGDYEVYQYDGNVNGNVIEPKLILSYRDSVEGVPMVNYPISDNHGNLLFSNDKIHVVFANQKTSSYPLGYFADQFAITENNLLWVLSRKNTILLFRIHPEDPDNYFELLKINDREVPDKPRSICFDSKGNLWMGTRDLGLFCFSVDEQLNLKLQQQITDKKGLSDNCILYLHGDGEGNIWACSPVGLDKIHQKNERWVVENISRANNIYQNVTKILSSKNGEHWALTRTGVIRLKPSINSIKESRVSILFTQIKSGKDTLNTDSENPAFAFKKNDLYFQWAVPSFVNEKQIQFSYQLKGSSSKDWSEPSSEAMVRFVNLAPGKYELLVKAVFSNGLYPDTETSYSFEILPPWWQTWWFRGFAALAFIFIVVLISKNYVSKKLDKQKTILEKRQAIEKERARIASDMHDDLGAGLSTIRFLSEKVKRNPQTILAKNEIEKIASISNNMVDSMNEIIWAMNEKNDTLEDLLFYTRSYAKEYCEEHQLDCQFNFPELIPALYVSGDLRRNVFLTVKESLHNIVKYAGATRVEIQIEAADHLLVIIRDNGKGFIYTDKEIFTKGNGLRNMKQRIESIGGKFILQTNQGVMVSLDVPLKGKFEA